MKTNFTKIKQQRVRLAGCGHGFAEKSHFFA